MFWWRNDQSRVRKWWNFRRAYKEGMIDFYSTVVLIIGGSTILIGVMKGSKNSEWYSEQKNMIKMKEIDLEMEKLKLEQELLEMEED